MTSQLRAARKAAGLCVTCTDPAHGWRNCQECRKAFADRRRELRAIAAGLPVPPARSERVKRERKPRKASSTGVRGVTFDRKRGLYQAQVGLRGTMIYLGRFRSLEDAVDARRSGEVLIEFKKAEQRERA